MEFGGIQTFLKTAVVFILFLLFMKGFQVYKKNEEPFLLARGKRQTENDTPPPPPWDPSLILGEASELRPVNFNDTQFRGTTQLPPHTEVTKISDEPSLPRSGESSSGRGSVSSETLLRQLLRSIGIDVEPRQPRLVERTTMSSRTSPRTQRPVGPNILEFDPLARLLNQGKSSRLSSVNGTEKSGNRTINRDSSTNESISGNITNVPKWSEGELHISKNETPQVLVNDMIGQTTKRGSVEAMSDITSTKLTTISGRENWTSAYLNSTQDIDVQTSTTRHARSREEFTFPNHVIANSTVRTTTDPSLDQNTKYFSLESHVPSTSVAYNHENNSSSFAAHMAADTYKSSTPQTTNEGQGLASSTQRTLLQNEPNLETTTSNFIIQSTTEAPSTKLAEDSRHIENSDVEILQSVKPVITNFKGTPSEIQGINFGHFKLPMLEKMSGTNNMVKGGLNRNRLNGPVK